MEVITKSSKETSELGRKIAAALVNSGEWMVDSNKTTHHTQNTKHGNVLALSGELGSGKTTFIQGFAEGLGIKQRIISPTFIILRKYKISPHTKHNTLFTGFYHIDLYRLEDNLGSEIKNLGLRDIWKDAGNIVAIEWAEKIRKYLPKNINWIRFENLGYEKRKITL